jgi:tetratricopeptide (TPR) repeat protein
MKTFFYLIVAWLTISTGFCQSGKEFLDSGREKIKLHNYGEAITDFSKAIEIEPQNADALFLRGTLKFIIDDGPGAIADLDKALEIVSGLNSVVDNQNRMGKETGVKTMNKVITNNSCIYCHMGYIKAKLDDPLEAISWYNKAIEANPKRGETWYRRGIVELLTGKKENACLDLNKAKELGFKQADEALKNYCP